MVDLKTIKSFKTIVETKSFQSAAEHLNYAQSTITAHIKKLEIQLGVILFDRENNLQLTEAGKLLDEKSDVLLHSFDQLEKTMTEFVSRGSEVIRIGVMEPTASYLLPSVLSKFIEQYPNIQISLQIHGNRTLMDMVLDEEIDMAICATPETYSQTVFEKLFAEEVVLLLPQNHPLSTKESIQLVDLKEEKIVVTNRQCPFRGIFEKKMMEKNCLPSYSLEVSNLLTLKYYVQAGFGPAIVPLISVAPPPNHTVIKRITDFKEGLTVGLLMKNTIEDISSMASFLKLLKTGFDPR